MSLNTLAPSPLVLSLVLAGTMFNGPARADEVLVRALAESNVNQRYLVESVSISGVEVGQFHDAKLPPSLRRRLSALVGAPCDMMAIGELAGKLRSTLRLEDVQQHLSRGSSPDSVRIDFEVVRREYSFDLSVPRFLYNASQGWTTEVNAIGHFRNQSITVGLGSNGDDLTERFTGFSTRYEDSHVFSDRIRFGLGIEGYHDLWNPSTRLAAETLPGQGGLALYRTRRNFAPVLTFVLSRELSVSVGASFEKMGMETPSPSGNQMNLSANAATAEVDFGYTVEGGDSQQRWVGKYGLRAATHDLGSDYAYFRQNLSVRYEWRSGRHVVTERITGGVINGQAPLFERFALGNSSTLEGWNRYVIDPLGGDRMAHNAVSYGYQFRQGTAEIFHEAGLIGNSNPGLGDKWGTLRHSLGIGFRQSIFNVAMAFPIREGRIAAVFMAGMNY